MQQRAKNGEELAVVPRIDPAVKEREEFERKLRFLHRKGVDELVKPILNLEIIEMFNDVNRPSGFDPIPI